MARAELEFITPVKAALKNNVFQVPFLEKLRGANNGDNDEQEINYPDPKTGFIHRFIERNFRFVRRAVLNHSDKEGPTGLNITSIRIAATKINPKRKACVASQLGSKGASVINDINPSSR